MIVSAAEIKFLGKISGKTKNIRENLETQCSLKGDRTQAGMDISVE